MLDTGGALTPHQLRRLACDAGLIPCLLDGDSQPLDVGRARRTWTDAQRRAVTARDRGCTAPGCDRPPAACHLHHRDEWSQGGNTDIRNAALLCDHHHGQVHRQGWKVVLAPNGYPAFLPPETIDPEQRLDSTTATACTPSPSNTASEARPRAPRGAVAEKADLSSC